MKHELLGIRRIAQRLGQGSEAKAAMIKRQFGSADQNFHSLDGLPVSSDRPKGLSKSALVASGIAGTGLVAAGIGSQINTDPAHASLPEPTPIHRGVPKDIQDGWNMVTPYAQRAKQPSEQQPTAVEAALPITDSFKNLNVTPEWLAQNPLRILHSESIVSADGNVVAKFELKDNGFIYKSQKDASGVFFEYINTSSAKIPVDQPKAFSVSPDGGVIVVVGSDVFGTHFSSALSTDGGAIWTSLGTSSSEGGAESVSRLEQYTFLVTLNTSSSAIRILRAEPRAQVVEPLSDPSITSAPRDITITSLNESIKEVQWFGTNKNGGLNFTILNYDKNTAAEQNISTALIDGEQINLGNLNGLFVYTKDSRRYALTSNNDRGHIYKLDVTDLTNVTGTKHSFIGLIKDKVANYDGGEQVNAIYGKLDEFGKLRISAIGTYQSRADAASRVFAAYYSADANFSIDKTTLTVDDFVPNQVSTVAEQKDIKPETINGQYGLNIVVKNTIGKLFRLLNTDGSPANLEVMRPNKGLEKVIALATATPTASNTPTEVPKTPTATGTPTKTSEASTATSSPTGTKVPDVSPTSTATKTATPTVTATVIAWFKHNLPVIMSKFTSSGW